MNSKGRRLLGACLMAALCLAAMGLALHFPHLAVASQTEGNSLTSLSASPPNDTGPNDQKKPVPGRQPRPIKRGNDVIDIGPVVRSTKFPVDQSGVAPLDKAAAAPDYQVGDIRRFLILDTVFGLYRVADYDVRLISDTVEVWVQRDLRYRHRDMTINPIHPEANHPREITQQRINALAAAAEVIIAKDVEYFGDYADRSGESAFLPDLLGLPADYYAGPPKRVIILVSNVRDDNFYDPINNPSRIVGFFSPTLNFFADRNIMTIDSSRWDVWVGPPQFQYEATIAHEFQHLINGDHDPGEESWANEGRSEFAEFLMGYRPTPEDHRTQFSDYPENSLVIWGDQDDDPDQPGYEILADYQQAYWFFLYLAGRLQEAGINTENEQFLKDVSLTTSDPLSGSASIDAMLERVGATFRFRDLYRDFQLAMLYGGASDETPWGHYISQHQGISGVPVAPLDLGRLRRNLNFEGYDQPGVAPYSTDYIEIGWSTAITTGARLSFNGDTVPPPTAWTVIRAEDTGIPPTLASGNVLYSGHTDLADNFLIFPVTVPITGNQTLSFDTLYNIEADWDFGFVQVTTDTVGGRMFRSLPISGTTVISDADAHPLIQANVPGFSGVSGSEEAPAWVRVTYDLAGYAGQSILLAFRYATDWGSAGQIDPPPDPGWYLDNIMVGDTALYTDEENISAIAQSIWEVRNVRNTFELRLVTFADKNGPAISQVYTATINADGDGEIALGDVLDDPGFDGAGERLVALVSLLSPERDADLISIPQAPAGYRLTGLPPSVYTSRARATGTANDTTIATPAVYPGDTFTLTVVVDDLGRNDDLSAAPVDAYVAVPVPPHTSFVAGSLRATVATENITYTANLQSLDAGLPAQPGVYWHGTVTRTATLDLRLRAAEPLAINTVLTPTVHIANGSFAASPSQSFTQTVNVRVSSPFALSTATGSESVRLGQTAVYTYTLINTDDRERGVDMRIHIPDGTTLTRIRIDQREAEKQAAANDQELLLSFTVPSYLQTERVTVVTLELRVGLDFRGGSLNPAVELLQPGSHLPWVNLPLDIPGGATTLTRFLLALPHILTAAPPSPTATPTP